MIDGLEVIGRDPHDRSMVIAQRSHNIGRQAPSSCQEAAHLCMSASDNLFLRLEQGNGFIPTERERLFELRLQMLS